MSTNSASTQPRCCSGVRISSQTLSGVRPTSLSGVSAFKKAVMRPAVPGSWRSRRPSALAFTRASLPASAVPLRLGSTVTPPTTGVSVAAGVAVGAAVRVGGSGETGVLVHSGGRVGKLALVGGMASVGTRSGSGAKALGSRDGNTSARATMAVSPTTVARASTVSRLSEEGLRPTGPVVPKGCGG